jgi:hypothetical protein
LEILFKWGVPTRFGTPLHECEDRRMSEENYVYFMALSLYEPSIKDRTSIAKMTRPITAVLSATIAASNLYSLTILFFIRLLKEANYRWQEQHSSKKTGTNT